MRYIMSEEEKREIDEITPYVVTMLPKIKYKEGTPQYIIDKHKKLIKQSFEEACQL